MQQHGTLDSFHQSLCGIWLLWLIEAALWRLIGLSRLNIESITFQHFAWLWWAGLLAKKKKLEGKNSRDSRVENHAPLIFSSGPMTFCKRDANQRRSGSCEFVFKFAILAETEDSWSDLEEVIMFNPEMESGLGENDELEVTYKRMGEFHWSSNAPGYPGIYLLTGNRSWPKK